MSTETVTDDETNTEAEERRSKRRPRFRHKFWTASKIIGIILPILIVGAGMFSIRDVRAENATTLGLVDIYPPMFYGVLALLCASFTFYIRRERIDRSVMVMHVLALIFMLHGSISWVEGIARFATSYTHVGLAEYIQRTNHALPALDARMSWPGFFAATALLSNLIGAPNALPLLLWAPLVMNLMFAPLIFMVARSISDDSRVTWLATWFFFSADWVGQDYFAPQAVNFLIFLAFVAILLRCFRTDTTPLPPFLLRRIGRRLGSVVQKLLRTPQLRAGSALRIDTSAKQRAGLMIMLVILYGACVVSHQLTPFFLLIIVVLLAITRRTQLRGLPLLLGISVFTYISYGAIGFWSGHLSQIFGGLGKVSAGVASNVASPATVQTNHTFVLYGRIGFALVVWVGAVFGAMRRVRKGIVDGSLMLCFISPFFVLGGQDYGGEGILRVFLFSLPFAATLIALALVPNRQEVLGWLKTLIVLVVTVALIPAFMLTRFGNEAFEYITPAELAGQYKFYDIAPRGSAFYNLDSDTSYQLKLREQYVGINGVDLPQLDGQDLNAMYAKMTDNPTRPTYLIITKSELDGVVVSKSQAADWPARMLAKINADKRFVLQYENPSTYIYRVIPPPGTVADIPPQPPPAPGSTPADITPAPGPVAGQARVVS